MTSVHSKQWAHMETVSIMSQLVPEFYSHIRVCVCVCMCACACVSVCVSDCVCVFSSSVCVVCGVCV